MFSNILFSAFSCAIAGAIAKICDDFEDRHLKVAPLLAFFLSLLYGFILGMLSAYTILASLFLAIAIANILAQKIDGIHLVGLCSFSAVIIFFGLYSFNPWIFCILLFCAIFDELELRNPKLLSFISENRLCVPFGALITSLYMQDPIFFVSIISFDIFYKTADHIISKKLD
jgi:hypothetical protein